MQMGMGRYGHGAFLKGHGFSHAAREQEDRRL
jgi:hypothetical protein